MDLSDGTVRKRRKAINAPGCAHELTFTCERRMKLLRHDRTRRWMVEAMEHVRRKHDVRIIAYVIMPEHAHVLLRANQDVYSMAAITKSLKQSVSRRAVAWLRKHSPEHLSKLRVTWPSGRVEYRFWRQGGGYDRNMWTEEALVNAIRYIHLNPVRAGLVREAREWEWSSARAYLREKEVVMEIDRVRLARCWVAWASGLALARGGVGEGFLELWGGRGHGQAQGGLPMPPKNDRPREESLGLCVASCR